MTKLRHWPLAAAIGLSAAGLYGCSDDSKWDDVDGAAPQIDVTSDHIMTQGGRDIHFAGKVADRDGISAISLRCPELQLDKTISLIEIYGEPLKEYDLDYLFHIDENEIGDDFVVEITVTDIGGRNVVKNVSVTMDGDFTPPVFLISPDKEVMVLIKPITTYNLRFTVQDNRVIDYVEVEMPGVDGFPLRIDGNDRSYIEFSQKLPLPAEKGTYNVIITAFDKPAQDGEVRSVQCNSVVTVDETPDFEKLWLCDVNSPAELNSDIFGVPMLVDHVGPYQYSARYYNEKAGTKICFLAQKTDFTPICYGPDQQYNGLLGDDPDTAGRITLDQGGVYYKIDFNIKTGVYTLQTYSVDDAVDPVMHMHFGQDDLNTWFDFNNFDGIWWQSWYFGPASGPTDVISMRRDTANPHIYILDEWKLQPEKMHFILHNWHHDGWWNYTTWRVDNSADPEKFMYYGSFFPTNPHFESNADYFDYKYGGNPDFNLASWADEGYRKSFVPDNWCEPTVTTAGTYKLIFDAHLERARLVPAK